MNLPPETCYRAHCSRDARFDGLFFTGVRTTRIYCRPICPARTPALRSCQFFASASAAEAAGFRPCLRCRPELAPGSTGGSLAQAVMKRLQERAAEGEKLADLERDLGLSLRQVRRLLRAEFGVTPVQVAQTQRLLLARQWLQETTQPISEIALSAGFRSLRQFNTLFRDRYRRTPSQCRRKQAMDGDGIRLNLAYRPPLAWAALLDYFRSRLVPGVEEIDGLEYRRTVTLGDAIGWFTVSPSSQGNALVVHVASSLSRHLGAVQTRVRRMFDLDARPDEIASILGQDPMLAPILARHPGLRVGGAWDAFELAVRAVLGQQISVAAATTLSGRLVERVGGSVTTPFANLHRLAITPQALATLNADDLSRLGLVRARAETLLHLAAVAEAGGLNFSPGTDHESAVARLVQLPGIGPWTAHYIAMRALRYPDAFPAADLGLRKAMGDGQLITARQAETRAMAWRPWRAYAAALLWKSLG